MSLVRLNSLSMGFGGQELFTGLTTMIARGEHIGLVGPNGVGKTTLLRLLMSELEPSTGHVAKLPGVRVGYLPQQPEYPLGQTVLETVVSGMEELVALERELKRLEAALDVGTATSEFPHSRVGGNPLPQSLIPKDSRLRGNEEAMVNGADSRLRGNEEFERRQADDKIKLATRYAELLDHHHSIGGSSASGRAMSVLSGLGVAERLWEAPMETLSGGERNIIALAQILVGEYDVILLDEPGNHLDFSGLEWLENYLSDSAMTFLVVSHNRYLLDRVCNRIWELERGRLEQFTGNYSDYRSEKLTRKLKQESAFQRQQLQIARLEFQIQRLKSWGAIHDNPGLSKRAKAFERRIEKMEKVERPTEKRKISFRLGSEGPKGTIALQAREYFKEFEDGFRILDRVNFLVTQGERVAFVGNNGTGKSSLIKDVVSDGHWDNPRLRVGKSVRIGYFSQLVENLNSRATLLDEAQRLTGLSPGSASELMHRFLFTRDDLEKTIGVLSGGEKARLQLAALIVSGADMLLLDEPTNHLDVDSREAVEDALEDFPGTLVMISHDRYFLDKLAERVLYFRPPSVLPFDGNFSEFWEKRGLAGVVPQLNAGGEAVSAIAPSTKKPKNVRLKFDPQRFKQLEVEIERLEQLKPPIEEEIVGFLAKGKVNFVERRRARLAEIDAKLEELYEEWVELGERKKKW